MFLHRTLLSSRSEFVDGTDGWPLIDDRQVQHCQEKNQLAHSKVKVQGLVALPSGLGSSRQSSTRRTHAEASLGLAFNPRRQWRGGADANETSI